MNQKKSNYRKVKDLKLICPKCNHKRTLRIYDRLDIDVEEITSPNSKSVVGK